MDITELRGIMHSVAVDLKSTLAKVGCGDPLVEVRLTDVDTAPEAGPYLDVAVSARIRLADYLEAIKCSAG